MFEGSSFVYSPTAESVARAMLSSGAHLINREKFFQWKSGIVAPVYTDCRRIMSAPGARTLIKKALGSATLSAFGAPAYVIGIAEAGIHWSALVADDLGARHAFVRKTAKAHGVGKMVAGIPDDQHARENNTAVLVDDLVASGGSLLHAVDAIQSETNLRVIGVVTIVNWGFPAMRDVFRNLNIKPVSLVSYPEILAAALADGRIDESFCDELIKFYLNPHGYDWSIELDSQRRRVANGTGGKD